MQIDQLTFAGIPVEIDFAEIRREARNQGELWADCLECQPHEREEVIRRMSDLFVQITLDCCVDFYGARENAGDR